MKTSLLLTALSFPVCLFAQQVSDTTFRPEIRNPEYRFGKGPIVMIDEAHHNFHNKDGRYGPFAYLLERDGYVVKGFTGEFTPENLSKTKILVISNALNEINEENWYLPTPSAFTPGEIIAVQQWVEQGGRLFLIADHMPLAGAAKELAAAFGFEFSNGFAVDTTRQGTAFFSREENTLADNNITNGRNPAERIDKIATFTGQAFRIPADATPILTFGKHYINLMPDTAWVFTDKTPTISAEGWSQGAYKKSGKGKVVVFGEAAMFTAQLSGSPARKVGMNDPAAGQNYRLLLNIMHWLDR